ncbi:MAG: carbohydrate ABC transporter permease, partial [Chloroflexota bacterium]
MNIRRLRNLSSENLFLALLLLFCLLPLAWTLLASFDIAPNNNLHPPVWSLTPSLNNYSEVGVTDPNFMRSVLSSLALSTCTTLLTTSVAFLAVYGLVHSRFRGRDLLVQCFLILASLPVISYVLPLQDTLRNVHLLDTFSGLVLSEAALFAPLAAYVLYGYFSQLSADIEDAARIDGADIFHILRWVILPIAAPGLAATAIIIFVLSWNHLLMPLFLTGRFKTIPTQMIDSLSYERELEWPTAAAAIIVSLLPIGIFVALAHRLLEQFRLT